VGRLSGVMRLWSATGQIKMWLGQCKGCVHLLTLLFALTAVRSIIQPIIQALMEKESERRQEARTLSK